MICPLCKNLSYVVVTSLKAQQYVPAVRKCIVCNSQFLAPPPPDGWLENYFSSAPTEVQRKQIENSTLRHFAVKHAKMIARWIGRRLKGENIGTVYDIGCGPGWLLSEFKSEQCTTVGIEPNPLFSSFARKELRLNILEKILQNVDLKELPGRADLVILMHIVHMADDIETMLRQASQKLRYEGYMFLEVPNEVHHWRAFWRRAKKKTETLAYYRPCKTVYPTKKGMLKLMKRIGIKVIKSRFGFGKTMLILGQRI